MSKVYRVLVNGTERLRFEADFTRAAAPICILDDDGCPVATQYQSAHACHRPEKAVELLRGQGDGALWDPSEPWTLECAPSAADRADRITIAEAWIGQEGAVSWVGLRDPDRLGCSAAEHEEWLATAPENEIRSWAKSVAVDEEG